MTLLSIISQLAITVISTWSVNWYSCEVPKNWIVVWAYAIKWTNKVYLCDNWTNKKENLIHETWHYVYWNKLSEKGRQKWIKLFNSSTGSLAFVSNYAMTNPSEDFAETFKAYYMKENLVYWMNNEFINETRIRDKKLDFIKQITKIIK